MNKLTQAFEIVSPKKMIIVDAVVNLEGYERIERIVINLLQNNKFAIFRYDSYRNKHSGYKTFSNENDLLSVLEIKDVISMNPALKELFAE